MRVDAPIAVASNKSPSRERRAKDQMVDIGGGAAPIDNGCFADR